MMDREAPVFVAGVTWDTPARISTSKPKKGYPAAQVIAERIRTARIAANKTQQELADHLYSKSYISAIERAKMTPSLQALMALAARLDVDVSYFFGEGELHQGAVAAKPPPLDVISESERAAREKAALLDLVQAETFIRQDKSHEALERLGSTPSDVLPLSQRPRWYWLVGWASTLEGRPDDAKRVLEQGFHLAENLRAQAPVAQRDQPAEMVEWLRCFLGVAACAGGQMKLALNYYRRGLAAIEERVVKDAELKLLIYKGLGNAYWNLGWYQEAIGYYQKAVEQANNVNNERQRGLAYWGLGKTYETCGDLPHAEESFRQALLVLGPLGNLWLLAQLRGFLGQVLLKQGRYEEAEKQLRKSLETAQELGDPRALGVAWGNIAALHHARGELDKAIQAANEGLQSMAQSEDHEIRGQLQLTLASVYEAAQDSAAAERMIREAISTFEQTEDNNRQGRAHDHYAQFLEKQGRLQEAYVQMRLARTAVAREPQHHQH